MLIQGLCFLLSNQLLRLGYELFGLLVEHLAYLIQLGDSHLSSYRIRFIQGILSIGHLLLKANKIDVELLFPVSSKPQDPVLCLRHNGRVGHEMITVEVAVICRLSLASNLRRKTILE